MLLLMMMHLIGSTATATTSTSTPKHLIIFILVIFSDTAFFDHGLAAHRMALGPVRVHACLVAVPHRVAVSALHQQPAPPHAVRALVVEAAAAEGAGLLLLLGRSFDQGALIQCRLHRIIIDD